jgi:hypothetical protein
MKVLTSRAKQDHICFRAVSTPLDRYEWAPCRSRKGPTRSRTVDSFDCKAMRELNKKMRRGSLTRVSKIRLYQDRALHASSSIFDL